jgi:L-alanine-DL-glutamate epimerase-like enolase superfamily enzyme
MATGRRERVRVPIAVGEQFGYKWDVNRLIERELVDYVRCQLPNTGGITEYMKIIALAETHYIGLIPHFTGPIAEAALVHCLTATSSVALMEMLGDGSRTYPHLPDMYDFRAE